MALNFGVTVIGNVYLELEQNTRLALLQGIQY